MKVFDLHCDTLSELRYAEEAGQPKSFAENDLQIDLKKLQKGDYMLQCFAAFVNLARPGQDPLVAALEEIDIFKRIMAKYSDFIAPVYQPEDLRKNAEAGKISGMLTIEEGGCCKGSLGVLRLMHELGVRMMTLTWNHENELASPNVVPGADTDTIWPCQPNTKTGLKEKGFEFLAEMERLHIIADVSHLSDKGFWDIAEHSTRPLAASHSNCRALCDYTRNLTDDQLRALAQTGGTVGLNLYPPFLGGRADFDTLRAHLEHMLTLCGEDHVALGGDLDGCDELARGFTDVSSWASFYAYLQAAGYPADLLDRIFFRNLLQLLQGKEREGWPFTRLETCIFPSAATSRWTSSAARGSAMWTSSAKACPSSGRRTRPSCSGTCPGRWT